jgi:hypothetical protein
MALAIGVFCIIVATWYVYGVVTQRVTKGKEPPNVPCYLPFGLGNMWELTQVSPVVEIVF